MESNLNPNNTQNIQRFQSGESINPSSSFEFPDDCGEEECEYEEEDDYEESDIVQFVINQIYEDLLPIIVINWKYFEPHLSEEEDNMKIIVTFKNGNVYQGYAYESRFHGEGSFIWADEAHYDGNFYRNYGRGIGQFTNSNGDCYLGYFSQGVSSHGMSNLKTDNFTYNGSFLNGHFHGKGVFEAPPLEFNGIFAVDIPVTGIRKYNSGTFVGDFDDCGYRKYGKYVFKNLDTYYGHWLDDKYNDYGVYRWSYINPIIDHPLITNKETVYSGFWLDGNRNGVGLLKFDDIIIVSKWKFDKKEGCGMLRAANGQIFVNKIMFKKGQYNGGSLLILNDETKYVVKQLIDIPDKFDGRNDCHLKHIRSHEYKQCKDILQNTICQLLPHTEDQTVFTPYFLSNYQIDKNVGFVEYIESMSKKIENISVERELKALRQAIQDNYHTIKLMYIKYAIFDRSIKREDLQSTISQFHMNRLGLWLFYNDVLSKLSRINKMDNIELCDKLFHLLPKDSLDPKDPIYFWEFLRHLIHIVVIINKTNCTIYEQALYERESIFGIFATMFLIFLREFSIIHKTQESISWNMILDCPNILQSLLIKIHKNQNKLNIREAYIFFHNIKAIRDRRITLCTINILENVTDENFFECCSKLYPKIVKDGIVLDTSFSITPLELCEIIYLCFEKEIWHRNVLEQNVEKYL